MNNAIRSFALGLGLPPEEMAILDTGSSHPYSCTCNKCLQWWILMGPEGRDAAGVLNFGPFTPQQIRDGIGNEAEANGKFAVWEEDN